MKIVGLVGVLLLASSFVIGQAKELLLPPPIPEPMEAQPICGGPIIGKRKIIGKVIDEQGNELISCNIQIDGIHYGTITDFDGEFELIVPDELEKITLQISFIGFESQAFTFTQRQLNKNPKVYVTLKEKNYLLDEVVVTAFAQRRVLTYWGGGAEIADQLDPSQLKQVDKTANHYFIVYPNPFHTSLHIRFYASIAGNYKVNFLTSSGQLLRQSILIFHQGQNQFSLSVSDRDSMAGKTYLVQIIGPDGERWVKHVVKAKQ